MLALAWLSFEFWLFQRLRRAHRVHLDFYEIDCWYCLMEALRDGVTE